MELVEGVTLAERVRAGAVPFEEALPIAKQIAEGLEFDLSVRLRHKPSPLQILFRRKILVEKQGEPRPHTKNPRLRIQSELIKAAVKQSDMEYAYIKRLPGKCETCSRETPNPRFCSRSCAATSNNLASPKRKLEGECQRCRTPITRRKRYCQDCQPMVKSEKEEQARRRREKYKSWLTSTGERREGPVVPIFVRKVFRADGLNRKKLTYDNSAANSLIS